MALSEVTTATIIALTVLLIVTTVGYYTMLAGATAARHATASRAAASRATASNFTPTCTVGLTGGSMPIIDPVPYPAGCTGCSPQNAADMNCCSASEVPPAVE